MEMGFREHPEFTAVIDEYFGGDDEYRQLQTFLAANPERGVVIPGTSGLRKLRWHDPRRGKGKRGGLRIIYLYVPLTRQIGLIDVYNKDEADDLTPADKKMLAPITEALRVALLEGARGGQQ
jgi:mRNA-degrading endonuclease RelE of RelBE toxin-antitoxin system